MNTQTTNATYLIEQGKDLLYTNKAVRLIFPLVILILQNGLIFYRHYFKGYGFPWDFTGGYYAFPAFWTGLVSQGYFPTWIPYQQMGYPMDLLLQSGFHYPPLWVFPLLQIPYTLNAAVAFQCLHVLFGAFGMFFFLKRTLGSNGYALIGAFAFQFFGGFYSNSEHVDIIRAFSFTPWLFTAFYIDRKNKASGWHFFLIPVIIFLLSTGGYPGNLIASILVIALYVFFQLIQHLLNGSSFKETLYLASIIAGMTILGFGLAFIHLGPGWLYRGFMFRTEQTINFIPLGIGNIPGLIFNNNIFAEEISMSSAFVTLPIFVLLFFVSGRYLKQWWPIAFVSLVSMWMIGGPNSLLWYLISRSLSLFRYSRFPSSDYRTFIVIPIIFFAVLGLKTILEREIGWKQFIGRAAGVVVIVAQITYFSYLPAHQVDVWTEIEPVVHTIQIVTILLIALSGYIFIKKWSSLSHLLLVGIVFVLIGVNGWTVISAMETWQAPDIESVYANLTWSLKENGRLITYQLIEKFPNQRPARAVKENPFDFGWEGYLNGRYLQNDLVPNFLKSAQAVNADPVYLQYMLSEWTPLLLENQNIQSTNLEIPRTVFSDRLRADPQASKNFIQQTRYGINEITYKIALSEPRIFIENEIYFPGWKARLKTQNGDTNIQAISTNGVFRTWALPAGNYEMVASFVFPNTALYRGASIASLLLWMGVLIFRRKINSCILNE